MVVVAGQPGAGKTRIADLVQAVLDRRGGAVRVGQDLYKPVHGHYACALAAEVRTAGALPRPDTTRWQAAVEAHVREMGFDAVVESALADPAPSILPPRGAGRRLSNKHRTPRNKLTPSLCMRLRSQGDAPDFCADDAVSEAHGTLHF
ncbi:zeta toxin family protein [Streptomyces sp. NPDC047046]|uniref:zeta toxin family protein n=1 Tax=Streptomyces sp. NPDC047046 TaxID=3155378 RepID=UPI0033C1C0D5